MIDQSVRIRNLCTKNGLVISEAALSQIITYGELLLVWNQKINLISRRDEENIFERHILICISLLFKFRIPGQANIVDIGTGGGLPGIPFAILLPECRMTLLDSIKKKMTAVNEIVKELKLPNADIVTGRAEEIAREPKYRGLYTHVLSRAAASITDIAKWATPLLSKTTRESDALHASIGGRRLIPSGTIVLYKGGDLTGELEEARKRNPSRKITVENLVIEGIDPSLAHDKKLVFINEQ